MLDHNTVTREGDLEPFVKEFKGEVIMIDHHPDPDDVTYRISDTSVSSTCELLYNVISGVWGKEIIDTEQLMSLYSIVFQDVTLFDNTILENIRLGRKDATDEEVLAAAKLANCDEFAENLPDKWNTDIGENGCALSGGERQRISIARAFLKDAPIILLDEATASLDVENETLIQTALSRLIRNKTVLIIAHRCWLTALWPSRGVPTSFMRRTGFTPTWWTCRTAARTGHFDLRSTVSFSNESPVKRVSFESLSKTLF